MIIQKKNKSYVSALATSLLLASSASMAAQEGVYLLPNIGYQWFDDERNIEDTENLGLNLGYQFASPWALELGYHRASTETQSGADLDLDLWHLDALYSLSESGRFQPFLLGGIADQQVELQQEHNETLLGAGVGTYYRLHQRIRLRTDIRALYSLDHEMTDLAAFLGIQFRFGGDSAKRHKQVEPPVASTRRPAVEPVTQPVVQETIEPTPVQPALVDKDVADSDGDGVADAQDRCADSLPGIAVDSQGCMLDADQDGIGDALDQCPDTRAGARVDDTGCYIILTENVSYSLNIGFASGSARLLPEFQGDVAKLADFLKQYPNSQVVIEGHTDSSGSAALNQRLSQQRAETVVSTLVQQYGIDATRLSAKGMGEAQPVASNDTVTGRKANRRVVAVVQAQRQRIAE